MFKGLNFGIPKEIMDYENRVAVTPETVKDLVYNHATVHVQTSAGKGSGYSDEEYRAAGARITTEVDEIFKQADIILKVKEPLFNPVKNKLEVEMMRSGQVLVTFLHPASPSNHEMVKKLASKGVTGFTLDGIPRISRAQTMDALTSMSTVAGYKAVLVAANKIAKFIPMISTAIGVIQPAKVLVIGVGVAGLQAIATAKRLGAVVYATDIRPEAVEHAKSLGAKTIESGVLPEVAVGEGGYAKSLPKKWIDKEREALRGTVKEMDIIILSALVQGKRSPVIITEDMVKSMAAGSVIIDISIDQGGNCEATEPGEIAEKYNVTIFGRKNIPSMLPYSATRLFAKNIYNFVSYLVKDGSVTFNLKDEIIASTLVTMNGKIVKQDFDEEIRAGGEKQ